MWLVPLEALTEDQRNSVHMSTDRHRIIVGGPGSGKTLVLVHRAHQAIARGVPPDRVKVLVYTRLLRQYLQEGVSLLGLPEDAVSTFDAWCLTMFDTHVKGKRPVDDKKIIQFEVVRERVLAKIRLLQLEPLFDVILVDEGQDLSATALELLSAVSRHVTVALDARQQLYDTGMNLEMAAEALGIRGQGHGLLTAYRCTPLIVDLAAEFISDMEEAMRFRRANLLRLEGIEKPVFVESDDDASEWDALAGALKTRALAGQTSAVLLPTKYWVRRTQRELQARSVSVSTIADADFGDLQPEVLTYHTAKGLTVDAVFLPGLTKKRFANLGDDFRIRALLFVGITRATRWVWLGTRAQDSLDQLSALPSVEQRGSVMRLEVKALSSAQPEPPQPVEADAFSSVADWL